jgi:uncharacterized protein YjbI with pentapeptide repeats
MALEAALHPFSFGRMGRLTAKLTAKRSFTLRIMLGEKDMFPKIRALWQRVRKRFVVNLLFSLFLFIIILILLIIWGYTADWTGFNQHLETVPSGMQKQPAKTLWDWMQLLVIPSVLAIGAVLLNLANSRTEQKIAEKRYLNDQNIAQDNQREMLLQSYLDRMTELLLKENLRKSLADEEVRKIARVRTLTVMRQLDTRRKNYVLSFLRDASLVANEKNESIVDLSSADWSGENLEGVDLSNLDLTGSNFSKANLVRADLRKSKLENANLKGANLESANLWGISFRHVRIENTSFISAILYDADFSKKMISNCDFSQAHLCHWGPGSAKFGQNHFKNINFSGATLKIARFTNCDFEDVDFSKADLCNAHFEGCSLKNVIFEDSDIKEAKFENVKLENTKVNNITLQKIV